MKRRYFVLAGLAGAGALTLGRYALSSEQDAIVKVLYKKLDYLKLDAAGVQRFAQDVVRAHVMSSFRLRVIDSAGPFYTRMALSDNNQVESGIRHGEERVVTLYLLSTDFFKNGADETRTVQYLGYYDPMVACGNPFARPAIDTTAA
jgi:hypothetical protein